MDKNAQVLIIGGGLAGLTAAIHLRKCGIGVAVVEKHGFPRHKVCGEYVSNEVLPYLQWLGLDIARLSPSAISKLQFSTAGGRLVQTTLPLGGFGLSRFVLDNYLYESALALGCEFIQETVEEVEFQDDWFTIKTSEGSILKSRIVLGAFGKRSNIDHRLNRNFIRNKSPWLAVKGHYLGEFPDEVVGLHNFQGGYCGVSKVENEIVNVCYLADFESFRNYRKPEDFERNIIGKNPHLSEVFQNSRPLFEKPLTISQISFEQKPAVENHVLMIGDTAGLIHPLCGNGMAMAMHSAKIACELIVKFYKREIGSRSDLEKQYQRQWDANFKKRMQMGRMLGTLMRKQRLSDVLIRLLIRFPFLLKHIIRMTHGKTISISPQEKCKPFDIRNFKFKLFDKR